MRDSSHPLELPFGCRAFGFGVTPLIAKRWVNIWSSSVNEINFFLVLAGSLTAEIEGISAAGATADSRRYTAIADAELLLSGPVTSRKWPLPLLPAGVSPALISYVASKLLGLKPTVLVAGLSEVPPFSYIEMDAPPFGPANCLGTGKAMNLDRVKRLWEKGFALGVNLQNPLLITECVPGGTTTALAVLTGLGMSVGDLVSGSNRIPPMKLKKDLVTKGLKRAEITSSSSPQALLAAVGDPFQAVAVGLLLGARQAGLPVLLGGGSQMVAVLGVALASIDATLRSGFVEEISIATTSWLADEIVSNSYKQSSFPCLINLLGEYFNVNLLGISSGLRFNGSSKKVLRDYELGFIKEGVGAGALSALAQINGISLQTLLEECELAVDQLDCCS